MAKRDPEKTARNKIIANLSGELKAMLPKVLAKTGFDSEFSLHGKIGGKFADYIDIKNEVIYSSDHFISLWLQGYEDDLKARGDFKEGSNAYETYLLYSEN